MFLGKTNKKNMIIELVINSCDDSKSVKANISWIMEFLLISL